MVAVPVRMLYCRSQSGVLLNDSSKVEITLGVASEAATWKR